MTMMLGLHGYMRMAVEVHPPWLSQTKSRDDAPDTGLLRFHYLEATAVAAVRGQHSRWERNVKALALGAPQAQWPAAAGAAGRVQHR